MAELLRITPQDNVAVALTALSSGQTVTVDGITLTTVTDVPAGHKVALFPIRAGEKVIKYGFPIGYAKGGYSRRRACACPQSAHRVVRRADV